MIKKILSATASLAMASSVAYAKSINIGFVTTLTTGAAIIGVDQKKAVDLAVEHIGGKMGALDVNIIYEDDEFNRRNSQKARFLAKADCRLPNKNQ